MHTLHIPFHDIMETVKNDKTGELQKVDIEIDVPVAKQSNFIEQWDWGINTFFYLSIISLVDISPTENRQIGRIYPKQTISQRSESSTRFQYEKKRKRIYSQYQGEIR